VLAPAPDHDWVAVEIVQLELRRFIADFWPGVGHHGAERRGAFVQNADLPGKREQDHALRDHDHPEQTIGNRQRLEHDAYASLGLRAAEAPCAASKLALT